MPVVSAFSVLDHTTWNLALYEHLQELKQIIPDTPVSIAHILLVPLIMRATNTFTTHLRYISSQKVAH